MNDSIDRVHVTPPAHSLSTHYLSAWDLSSCEDLSSMFYNAKSFNSDIRYLKFY